MQYLGGKAKIAKKLAAAVRARAGDRLIWEPFVGGANMTPHLRSAVASDRHAALISMYQAVQAGWTPPENVSEAEYRAAKLLPDSDPLKAFCGFACSFSGKWFGGYARSGTRNYAKTALGSLRTLTLTEDKARAGRLSLERNPASTIWLRTDFCTVEPFDAPGWAIYADPPYEGTTGYGEPFDHALFWRRCQEWTRLGVPVLVSEYACPVPHVLVFEIERPLEMHTSKKQTKRIERLFEVEP